jgi:hypothetical protein
MLGYLIRVAKPGHDGNVGRHPILKGGGNVVIGLSLVQHGIPDLHLLDGGAVVQVPVLVVQQVKHELHVHLVV